VPLSPVARVLPCLALIGALGSGVGLVFAQQSSSPLVRLSAGQAQNLRPAWTPDGARLAFQSNRNGAYQIWTVNADGSGERRVSRGEADDRHPTWSPDGRQIVFDAGDDRTREIWVMDADTGVRRQVTSLGAFSSFPSWSPDGRRISFFLYRDGTMDLWTVNVDASAPRALTSGLAAERSNGCTFACHAAAWSPDSETLAFSGGDQRRVLTLLLGENDPLQVSAGEQQAHFPWYLPDGRLAYVEEHVTPGEAWTDVWAIDPAGRKPPELLLQRLRLQGPYELSPDGERVAFHSPAGGNFDVYVADLTAPGAREALQARAAGAIVPGLDEGPPSGRLAAEGIPVGAPSLLIDAARVFLVAIAGLGGGFAAIRLTQLYRLRGRRRSRRA
jgi:Tol biopolymer transport system component